MSGIPPLVGSVIFIYPMELEYRLKGDSKWASENTSLRAEQTIMYQCETSLAVYDSVSSLHRRDLILLWDTKNTARIVLTGRPKLVPTVSSLFKYSILKTQLKICWILFFLFWDRVYIAMSGLELTR